MFPSKFMGTVCTLYEGSDPPLIRVVQWHLLMVGYPQEEGKGQPWSCQMLSGVPGSRQTARLQPIGQLSAAVGRAQLLRRRTAAGGGHSPAWIWSSKDGRRPRI